ncbi:pentatricopeptide repeat-containing protein, partial [Tanacetum coccineum]
MLELYRRPVVELCRRHPIGSITKTPIQFSTNQPQFLDLGVKENRKQYARDGLFLFLEMLGGDCGVKTMCDVEDDVYLGTGLVDMYAKCGCLDSALDMFRSMGCKNVMTWTSMVSGFVVHGKAKQALKFFNDMIESGIVPNSVTLTSLLFACSQAGLLEEGAVREVMNDKGNTVWFEKRRQEEVDVRVVEKERIVSFARDGGGRHWWRWLG